MLAPEPAFQVVCLPWAGGGASGFHALKGGIGDDVSLWAVAPPGREQRISDPAAADIDTWVDAIEAALRRLPDRPLVLFGHSFGAICALELARRLQEAGERDVALLCVSSRRAPERPSRLSHLAGAPDEALIAWMRRLGGAPDEVLDNDEMRELMLPPLRADLALDAAYAPRTRHAVQAPILALAGADDPVLDPAEMAGWSGCTRSRFEFRVMAGGHFYFRDRPAMVFDRIRRSLAIAPQDAISA
jgi:surfactin synthase thioesterase subunit